MGGCIPGVYDSQFMASYRDAAQRLMKCNATYKTELSFSRMVRTRGDGICYVDVGLPVLCVPHVQRIVTVIVIS